MIMLRRVGTRWLQGLERGPKLSSCLEVAQRGLSDLEAYMPAKAGGESGGGDISIALKGATS